uniref:Uncharacterized protein n=1 Tax=Aegilops tauschii subsp. strangulata TaxID=200361 RepID=A0A453BDC6_AEGTS
IYQRLSELGTRIELGDSSRCRSPSFTNASPSSSPTCGSRPCSFVADKLEQRRTEASWSKLQRASPTTMVSILVIHVHVLSVDAL